MDLEDVDADEKAEKRRVARRGAALMQEEERNIGAVNLQVYKQYFQSGNGVVLLPAMFVTIVLMQASLVLSYYWHGWSYHGTERRLWLTNVHANRLVWWQERFVFLRY